VKVGDLIKWVESRIDEGSAPEYGVVLQLSITGVDTLSAQVLFQDGQVWWLPTTTMEVVSEG
jgi:hypothetical protein